MDAAHVTQPGSEVPVSFVGRLAVQKGVDLLVEMIGRMAGSGRAHFVILGTGDPGHEDAMRRLAAAHPGTVDVMGLILADECLRISDRRTSHRCGR